jgi:TfoX/Sxy family transcriptional regulator of competence genes
MAYDQHLEERISRVLKKKRVRFDAKKMMGGLCYMIDDKMALGIVKDSLMIRIDPALYEQSLKKKGCRPMDFTGRVLKGFLLVDPIGNDMQKDLEHWIQLCIDFNPKAKSSKKPIASKTARKARNNEKKG